MAAEQSKIKNWLAFFRGMNCRQDLDKMPAESSPLILNCDLDTTGSISSRKGTDLLGAESQNTGNGVQALLEYKKNDGTKALKVVRDGDIDIVSADGNAITEAVASAFSTDEQMQSTNFLNRTYYISLNNYLAYDDLTSGTGSLTEVNSGNARIRGACLAVSPTTMYIGQEKTNPDRVYYSRATSGQPNASDFWNVGETSTDLANSTRYFSTITKTTAIWYYSVRGLLYAFSETEGFEFDVTQADNPNAAIRKRFNVGCANPRAITEVNGWLVWMDRNGRIWGWPGTGGERPLSWDLEDDNKGNSLISAIDKSSANLDSICAGSQGNKFYFSVGDLNYYGQSFNNVVIQGIFTQTLSSVFWSIYSLPWKPSVFTTATINNTEKLVVGSSDTDDVYQMNTGLNDNNAGVEIAINNQFITAYIDFKHPYMTKYLKKMFISYEPQQNSADNQEYIKVEYAKNNDIAYTIISDPDNTTPVINLGVINQYNSSATLRESVGTVSLPSEAQFRNISIKFSNNELGEAMGIKKIGYEVYQTDLDLSYKTS